MTRALAVVLVLDFGGSTGGRTERRRGAQWATDPEGLCHGLRGAARRRSAAPAPGAEVPCASTTTLWVPVVIAARIMASAVASPVGTPKRTRGFGNPLVPAKPHAARPQSARQASLYDKWSRRLTHQCRIDIPYSCVACRVVGFQGV
eukprot:SAG31_NODE_1679_length_7544_cov_3.239758_4_plen_147_part_00